MILCTLSLQTAWSALQTAWSGLARLGPRLEKKIQVAHMNYLLFSKANIEKIGRVKP